MTNDLILNRFFTRSYFKDLVEGKQRSDLFELAAQNCGVQYYGRTNYKVIEGIYQYLEKNYRNEFFYKNTLLNKLVFEKYKPTTTSALTEITIGKAKADFILINGKAVVYEIKSELDNLDRLSKQIEEYYKAFRYVTVATYLSNYDAVLKIINNPCVGICIVSASGNIDHKHGRKPQEYCDGLDYHAIFEILRKKEFEDIIIKKVGKLPECAPVDYYSECFSIIKAKISISEFQNEMEKRIKCRSQVDVKRIYQIPYEIKHLIYYADYREKDYQKMKAFLDATAEHISKEENKCTFPF